MSRLARTILMGIAFSVAVLTLGVGLVFVNIMGGFDDMLNGEAPKETDAEVVAARKQASADLRSSSEPLAIQAALSTSGSRLATGEVQPPCDIGEHNWKTDDSYDLLCTLARVEVVRSPSVAGFRDHMVALDAALHADGWEPFGSWDLQRVLTEYWDERAGFSSSYEVDNLRSASYSRWTEGELRTLAIRWATVSSDTGAVTYSENSLTLEWADGGATTIPAVLSAIPPEGYAVVLTESLTYYEE